MQNEIVAVATDALESGLGAGGCAVTLDVRDEVAPQRRSGQHGFFRRIEARDAEQGQIRFTNEEWFAPEAD